MIVSMHRQRIAHKAREVPELSFVSLNHYMDAYWMQTAYHMVRKDSAPGIDGQTVREYGLNLVSNLQDLEERVRKGCYRAPCLRRAHIPKGTGKETRPIGMPTAEDKVLQRAVVMLLEPIYEQDFLACSYGFREKRGAHQALDALWKAIMSQGTRWILDVDLRKCFDTLDHSRLRGFLDLRVKDGVIRRLIDEWLNAGVLEEGQVHYPEEGSPQGGVISPLLCNIFLHYALDEWFEKDVKPRLKGQAFEVRYADDFVLGFQTKEDAERVLEVLSKRLEKYGLTLHPEKTRLIEFGPPRAQAGSVGRGETFDFLGLTHYWGRSRKGRWVVKRQTARDRFRRTLTRFAQWCRANRHKPLLFQHQRVSQKYQGHQGYHGVTGNAMALSRMRRAMLAIWRKWLNRRSRKAGGMKWSRFQELIRNLGFPPLRVVHSVLMANP